MVPINIVYLIIKEKSLVKKKRLKKNIPGLETFLRLEPCWCWWLLLLLPPLLEPVPGG